MDLLTVALVALAAVATLAVAVEAGRRPILWRMAARNAVRRPRQTATVVAGLLVGTAIISSALVAGESAHGAIRAYVYQSLGTVDESVAIQGYPYFPEAVYHRLQQDTALHGVTDALSAHAIWQGAAALDRESTFEPDVALVGFEPGADAGFGDYATADGPYSGRDLTQGHAVATHHLADAMGLRVGDRVQVSFVLPIDPVLPRITLFNGTLAASAPGVPALPVPVPATPAGPLPSIAGTHTVQVDKGASFLAALLAWNPTPAPGAPAVSTLQVHAVAPNGTRYDSPAAGPGAKPIELLNVTVPPDQTLATGNWTLTVDGTAANAQYRLAVVVGYPVYDASLLGERAQALQGSGSLKGQLPGLSAFTTPRTANLTVDAIATGGRGDLFDFRDALFLRLDEAQALFHREGQVNLVKVSNPGDRVAGEAGTDNAMAALNASLADIKRAYPDLPAVQALEAQPLKREFLQQADAKGQTLTGLLVFAGSLSILTGLLLILNIFTMLAEERRSELGMARAVGLTRGDLVRLFAFEGSLYAVAAAAAGALLGFGLAWAMIAVMNQIVSHLAADLSFPAIQYTPTLGAFLVAFSLGALLTFATIVGASGRASRLNVVRAIRRVDEPEVAGGLVPALALGGPLLAVGLAASLVAWVPSLGGVWFGYRFTAQVVAPLVAAVGLGLVLRPWTRRHVLVPTLAAALAAYYTATFFLRIGLENRSEANVVGPLRGVLLTLAVVILAVHFEAGLRWLGRMLAKVRGLRPIALPALSYPLHRKFRTGMTVAMFSVVLLSIGFFSIFGALFQSDPARQTGGFDVEAVTTLHVPDLAPYDAHLPELQGVVAGRFELPEYRSEARGLITVNGAQTGTFRDYRHSVYGYDLAFAQAQRFHLTERIPAYATDADAYRGVLGRTDQVIVSYLYSTSPEGQALAHHAGDTLQLHLGNRTLSYTIAGIQEQYHFPGIFLPKPVVESLFPQTATLYLFTLAPGTDAQAAARTLERDYRGVGMSAKSTVAKVLDEQASFRQLLGAMKLFLGLGLVVGVLSLGIVTSRSVLERRQEIGMLRALGYTGRQVRASFFLEVTATILLGAAVGLACAVVVTYGLWFAIVKDLNDPYVIPWQEIGVLVLVSYAVAMLATWVPIGRSAKVAPAEALRSLE